ncbi:MAG TPA: NAD(P)-binding domain-containing protein [Xanthobacteraceae bacterium]|jgi:thioredoxin reductase|nr:NAD(P)-binding domain-containing protein [Xanthobacteraceae bacterium]
MSTNDLPVVVIGGGPIGLAAAAHLITRGLPVRLYESGETVAANVRDWGHVRLFSPWRLNIDAAAAALLRQHGWQESPPAAMPTGRELVDAYLAPLARIPVMAAVIRTRARVQTITRQGLDKVVTRERDTRPFALTVQNGSSGPGVVLARAVIDASGTWQTPNPLGASGVMAIGETACADRIAYGIPDVLGADHATYVGQRVLVVGGGHSAANALLDLGRLAQNDPKLRLTWAARAKTLDRIFGGRTADKLPARGKLGSDLQALVAGDAVQLVLGFGAERIERRGDALVVSGQTPAGPFALDPVDRIIVATGQRPDPTLTRELRLDLDPWLESPRALGPSIDPNLHSCGSVPPHGFRELAHPEAGYFTVGIKSYGRAPTFLMATGYEQVRSVAAYLAGDLPAAQDVRLVLPATGVCSAARAGRPAAQPVGA